ncbi:MAG: nucleotide disphospho-sugar-binding domain-containing protein [Dermatophilaceae bacterium]
MAAARAGIAAVALHIAMGPPAFFVDLLRRVADFRIGPVIDPRPDVWRWPDEPTDQLVPIRSVAWSDPMAVMPPWLAEPAPGPTAYLTLGTVAFGAVDVLRRSIQEAAARCARVLVAAGPEADLAALGDLPAHVHVERYVDQATVLGQVDVAIHHGGTGTLLGCLAAGVPQVITPQGADQFLNADRLGELGLGYAVRNEAADGHLGEALERVLTDEQLRSRVRKVRDDIARMPSPQEVVETLVRLGRPAQDPFPSGTD